MMVLATGDILRIGQDGAPSVLPGALLQLQSSLPDSGEHKVDMDLTGGSFGSLNASAHLAAGGKRLAYRLQPYVRRSRNDFAYLTHKADGGDSLGRRKSASYIHAGLQQHLGCTLQGGTLLKGHSMLVLSQRELPEPISGDAVEREQRSGELQGAHSLSLDRRSGQWDWHAGIGLHHQVYRYYILDHDASTTRAWTGQLSLSASTKGQGPLSAETHAVLRHEWVSSDNYQERHIRQSALLSQHLRGNITRDLTALLQARMLVRRDRADLLPAMEVRYMDHKGRHEGYLSFARALRQPTFNELYWNPGGNPGLADEQGLRTETGAALRWNTDHRNLSLDIHFFHHVIRNWVAWRPEGASPYWSPLNLGRVVSTGLESRIRGQHKLPFARIGLELSYLFTRAGESASGRLQPGPQLTYTPRHAFSGMLQYEHKARSLSLRALVQDRRYTRTDLSGWLPAFATMDLTASHRINPWANLYLTFNNITNTNYQLIAWYPMPRLRVEGGFRLQLIPHERTPADKP
ncbi:MAG TPA: TonB-dependent receptor, partial [Bacteroidales bacterium]|nr:TonB-dependent receptor [Bacteroidales bacterium]